MWGLECALMFLIPYPMTSEIYIPFLDQSTRHFQGIMFRKPVFSPRGYPRVITSLEERHAAQLSPAYAKRKLSLSLSLAILIPKAHHQSPPLSLSLYFLSLCSQVQHKPHVFMHFEAILWNFYRITYVYVYTHGRAHIYKYMFYIDPFAIQPSAIQVMNLCISLSIISNKFIRETKYVFRVQDLNSKCVVNFSLGRKITCFSIQLKFVIFIYFYTMFS